MSHQDLKTIVLRKKTVPSPALTNPMVRDDGKKLLSGKNSQGPDLNAAAVERKIDSGEITAPPTIPKDVAQARVAERQGDASDATPAVVERQFSYALGDISWERRRSGS